MSDLAASGGYYIAHAGAGDRRAAVHADRLDRHLRRQVRHRRRLREARRAHRVDEHRQARRDRIAGAAVQRRRAEEARRSSCRRSTISSSRRSAESRHSTPEKIDALAQGRVWTGRQAKENGLVDELGGLDRAIAIAKQRAKIAGRQRRRAGRLSAAQELSTSSCRDQFSGSERVDGGERVAVARTCRAGELEALRAMRGPFAMFRRGEPLALMPFTFLR